MLSQVNENYFPCYPIFKRSYVRGSTSHFVFGLSVFQLSCQSSPHSIIHATFRSEVSPVHFNDF